MIKLYQFPISHYCEKVRWALDYKSVDHHCINLLPGFHIKTIKKISPYSSVPVLKHNDQVIQGSDKIIDHIEEQFTNNMLTPTDAALKKQALQWENMVDQQLGDHVRRVCYHILLEHPNIVIPFFTHQGPWYGSLLLKVSYKKLASKMRYYMKINEQTAQTSYQEMLKVIEKIHHHLQNQPFLAGDQFSRADLAAASLLAPLCQPHGYGLNWPEKIPEPLIKIKQDLHKKIKWVYRVYEQYR